MSDFIKRKSASLLVMLAFILVLPILPVGASQTTRDRLAEVEERQQATRQQVNEQNNLLAGTRLEMNQIVEEMQILDQAFVDASVALENVQISLSETEFRILAAEEYLALAQAEWDLQYEILRNRVRAMHEHGPTGIWEALLNVGNITDFFIRLEQIRAVAVFDQELLDNLESIERRIASNVDQLASQRNLIEDLEHRQVMAREEIERTVAAREEWFNQLVLNEEQLEILLEILQAEQYAIDQEYGMVRGQLDREIAAEEARLAAQRHRERLANLNSFNGDFQWPIPTHGRVGSPFGMRHHPILHRYQMHTGIDVGAPTGTRLIAAQDGYVRLAGWSGGYGLTVIIDHADGYSTLYAHNSQNRVVAGQFVRRGDHIADVGSTGMSTGPHLHFEIRRNNVPVDPMIYFPGF